MKIGIIGFGQMGKTIALSGLLSGLEVVVINRGDNKKQETFILEKLNKALKSEKFNNLTVTNDCCKLIGCDVVIEAVDEDYISKEMVLKLISLHYNGIIVSNTSSLSISKLAEFCHIPDRFMGMHFMNPAHIIPLVECAVGEKTSQDTIETVRKLAEKLGKTLIQVGDSPGFVVNRLLIPMINEAIYLVENKIAAVENIDKSMKLGCGFPMGPLALADLIGLDICLDILESLQLDRKPCNLLVEYVNSGRLGKKSGEGFYKY